MLAKLVGNLTTTFNISGAWLKPTVNSTNIHLGTSIILFKGVYEILAVWFQLIFHLWIKDLLDQQRWQMDNMGNKIVCCADFQQRTFKLYPANILCWFASRAPVGFIIQSNMD